MISDDDQSQRTKTAASALYSIMQHLSMPSASTFQMEDVKKQAQEFALKTSQQNCPKLLLSKPLSADELAKVDIYIDAFNQDYAKRVAMLKKRVEVTIDSFLWSERVQKMEPQIRAICDASEFNHVQFEPVNADELLAADTDLLVVAKTAGEQVRKKTRVKEVCDYKLKADFVPDRGGRTEHMSAPQRESFQQQNVQRSQQRDFRGGQHGQGQGGGGGGQYHRGQQQDGRGGDGRGGGGHGQWNQQKRGGYDGGGKRGKYN